MVQIEENNWQSYGQRYRSCKIFPIAGRRPHHIYDGTWIIESMSVLSGQSAWYFSEPVIDYHEVSLQSYHHWFYGINEWDLIGLEKTDIAQYRRE